MSLIQEYPTLAATEAAIAKLQRELAALKTHKKEVIPLAKVSAAEAKAAKVAEKKAQQELAKAARAEKEKIHKEMLLTEIVSIQNLTPEVLLQKQEELASLSTRLEQVTAQIGQYESAPKPKRKTQLQQILDLLSNGPLTAMEVVTYFNSTDSFISESYIRTTLSIQAKKGVLLSSDRSSPGQKRSIQYQLVVPV